MKKLYVLIFTAICIFPLATFPFAGNQNAESASSVKATPELVKQGKLNTDFFKDCGDYFSYNFGFRQNYVTANAYLKSGIFHTSDEDNVVMGKDGWLYYGSSMNDFYGYPTMSDKDIDTAVTNLEAIQKKCADNGIRFVFTIAPNKNSLYPQYITTKYRRTPDRKNAVRMIAALEKSDVNFVNLYDLFGEQNEVLYHKTDSHWNNRGAALVNKALFDSVGKEVTDYTNVPYQKRNDFTGDLFSMLYPTEKGTDPEYYYQVKRAYTYDAPIESTFDPEIETTNTSKKGSLVMFRDSFGNSLLPFAADEFGKAYFTREEPFDVDEAISRGADTVVVEICERNLSHLKKWTPSAKTDEGGGSSDNGKSTEEMMATANKYMNKDIESLIAVLGKPDSVKVSPSCEIEGGEEKVYKWKGFSVYTLCQNKKAREPYLIVRVREDH